MSPELQAQIQIWRAKALNNTLTESEMAQAIAAMRADRMGAAHASEKSKVKNAKAVIPSADDLLGELDGL